MNTYKIYWSRTTRDTGQRITQADDKRGAELDARLYSESWTPGEHEWDFTARAVLICPECEGTNLNEDQTGCFDCQAEDYTEEREHDEPNE
jgi:uncharacterized paraquat-inducible protein A